MNAQQIINESGTKFNPKQFRKEMNLSNFLNDAVKEWKKQNE